MKQVFSVCLAGQYKTGDGSCNPCDGNYYSGHGASTCLQCPDGSTANLDKTDCCK